MPCLSLVNCFRGKIGRQILCPFLSGTRAASFDVRGPRWRRRGPEMYQSQVPVRWGLGWKTDLEFQPLRSFLYKYLKSLLISIDVWYSTNSLFICFAGTEMHQVGGGSGQPVQQVWLPNKFFKLSKMYYLLVMKKVAFPIKIQQKSDWIPGFSNGFSPILMVSNKSKFD